MKEITVMITDDKEKEIIEEALTTYRKEVLKKVLIAQYENSLALVVAEMVNNIGIEETKRIVREEARRLRENTTVS